MRDVCEGVYVGCMCVRDVRDVCISTINHVLSP